MAEPGGLPSMGSHRVRHDWSDLAAAAAAAANLMSEPSLLITMPFWFWWFKVYPNNLYRKERNNQNICECLYTHTHGHTFNKHIILLFQILRDLTASSSEQSSPTILSIWSRKSCQDRNNNNNNSKADLEGKGLIRREMKNDDSFSLLIPRNGLMVVSGGSLLVNKKLIEKGETKRVWGGEE